MSDNNNNNNNGLTAIFQDNPECSIPDFIAAKDGGDDGDSWSYITCKAAVKSSPPTN